MYTLHKQQLDDVDGFNVTFYALDEDVSPYDVFEIDEAKQLCQGIDNGKYVWFCAKVTASKLGIKLSSAYLGACCYDDYEDFIKDDYCTDLVDEAIAEAKDKLKQLCQ